MTDPDLSEIPIDLVLLNVSQELIQLCRRLHNVEKIIIATDLQNVPNQNLKQIQDMDLIIQQIADLSRTIQCVTEAELRGLTISTIVLTEKLHLRDLRDRLLGDNIEGHDHQASAMDDVHFF